MSAEASADQTTRETYTQPEDPFIGEVVAFDTSAGRILGTVERAVVENDEVRVHTREHADPIHWSDVETVETQGSFVCTDCNGPSRVPYICDDCRGERDE